MFTLISWAPILLGKPFELVVFDFLAAAPILMLELLRDQSGEWLQLVALFQTNRFISKKYFFGRHYGMVPSFVSIHSSSTGID